MPTSVWKELLVGQPMDSAIASAFSMYPEAPLMPKSPKPQTSCHNKTTSNLWIIMQAASLS